MLDTETIKNISTFVEITMQVEDRLRTKYDRELERLTEELAGQVKDLTGQKDRQAATIIELKDVVDTQSKLIGGLKEKLMARQEMPPAADEELQKKLDKAMDHIRRQGEEIDKLRAGAADPRWIPLKEKQPEWGVNVLTYSKRGTIYIAQTDGTGWKGQTGMISTPVAWMPMPKAYTGGEA